MLGALLGMGGKEVSAQQAQAKIEQKAPEKKSGTREKYDKMRNVGDEAKKLDSVEKAKYKQYLSFKKGSQEEADLFNELHLNYMELERLMRELLEYSTDQDPAIADKAMSIWAELSANVESRKKECDKAGKKYFDFTPAPKNPKPPKD